ncbi:MAG: hypothetical protein HRT72_06845 [Flavobacteriales bacterium]|nr:hypothetical protein [Flavobacteriales bacterium]
MDKNNTINELFNASEKTGAYIDSKELQPKEETIDFILSYSKSLKIYNTDLIDEVEVILN